MIVEVNLREWIPFEANPLETLGIQIYFRSQMKRASKEIKKKIATISYSRLEEAGTTPTKTEA